MERREALALIYELLTLHGLMPLGWAASINNRLTRSLGRCVYSTQLIELSDEYIRHNTPEHIKRTVLHEIAHALVGPRHGHDLIWQATARRIGGHATCSVPAADVPPRYRIACPRGCMSYTRQQAIRLRHDQELLCKHCKRAGLRQVVIVTKLR